MVSQNNSLNLEELAEAIRSMTRRQALYKVLRDELSKKGYWKNLPRGNPKKGYKGMEKSLSRLSRGK